MNANIENTPDATATKARHWKKISVLIAVVVVVGWYFSGQGSPSHQTAGQATTAGTVNAISAQAASFETEKPSPPTDEEYRELFVGTWETDRSGRRELVVNEDGTATMDVTIEDKVGQFLFGKQLVLNLTWEIENGILNFTTTGGEPSASVKAMTTLYGKDRKQKIITLNETTLHHPDDDPDGEDHVWTRVSE